MKPLYVVYVQWAESPEWVPYQDFPSRKVHAFVKRKDAVMDRQHLIYNSPYFASRYIRVRKVEVGGA